MSPHLLSGAARLAGSSLLRLQSDDRLLALIRDGHDPAYSAVVERYRPELLRYCTRLVGESRAEDVLQQVFLSAHMALRANDTTIQLRPWLYRIAHNAALNVLRAARPEAELDERLAAAGGTESDVEVRERLHEAFAAISRLPEPQRDALTLHAIEGRSHAEIAEALGVTSGAARQQVHRARASVRAAVSAITPYGLIVRLAMADTDSTIAPIAAGAGAGIGATVAKVGVGVIAAGAIGFGATNLPILPSHHRHHHHAATAPAQTAPAAEQASATAPVAIPAAVSPQHGAIVVANGHRPARHRGPASAVNGSGDNSSSGGSHSSQQHSSDHSHSGSDGSGSGGSGHGSDGSSSGDSHSGSGSSGSGDSSLSSGSSNPDDSSDSTATVPASAPAESGSSGKGSPDDLAPSGSPSSGKGSSGSGRDGSTSTTPTTTTPDD